MGRINTAIPKVELKRLMRRFILDKDRGISLKLFSNHAGLSEAHFYDVFKYLNEPLTEMMQIRVSKAYQEYCRGELAIMQNRDRSRFVQYRKEPKPQFEKTSQLQLIDGRIQIKLGIKPKYQYNEISLDEQLKGR
jgi:hypothetical protein